MDGRTDSSTDRQRADGRMDEWTDRWTDRNKDMQIGGPFTPFPQKEAKKLLKNTFDNGQGEGQRDGQMDGQSDGKRDKQNDGHKDVQTGGLSPSFPSKGHRKLKIYFHWFLLGAMERWTN